MKRGELKQLRVGPKLFGAGLSGLLLMGCSHQRVTYQEGLAVRILPPIPFETQETSATEKSTDAGAKPTDKSKAAKETKGQESKKPGPPERVAFTSDSPQVLTLDEKLRLGR